MSVGVIGSAAAAEALPVGAGAKIATIECAGYKKLGTLTAGKYLINSPVDAVVYDGFRKIGSVKGGSSSTFSLSASSSNVSIENREFVWKAGQHNTVDAQNMTTVPYGMPYESYISDDGTKNFLATNGGYAYLSTNSGATFKRFTTGQIGVSDFGSVAMSQNGSYLYVTPTYGNGPAKYSTDNGATWTTWNPTQAGYGYPVHVTTVGDKFFAICANSSAQTTVEIVYGTGTNVEGWFYYNTGVSYNYSTTYPNYIRIASIPNSGAFFIFNWTGSSYQFAYKALTLGSLPSTGTTTSRDSTFFNAWSGSEPRPAFIRTPDAIVSQEGQYIDSTTSQLRFFAANQTGLANDYVWGNSSNSYERGSTYYSGPYSSVGNVFVLPNSILHRGRGRYHYGYNVNQELFSTGGLEFFPTNATNTVRSYLSITNEIENSENFKQSIPGSGLSFYAYHRLASGALFGQTDNSFSVTVPQIISIYESAI